MSISRVKLRFHDLHTLWVFAKGIQLGYLEVEAIERVLTCYCDEVEMNLAVEKYGAEVLQNQPQGAYYK